MLMHFHDALPIFNNFGAMSVQYITLQLHFAEMPEAISKEPFT